MGDRILEVFKKPPEDFSRNGYRSWLLPFDAPVLTDPRFAIAAFDALPLPEELPDHLRAGATPFPWVWLKAHAEFMNFLQLEPTWSRTTLDAGAPVSLRIRTAEADEKFHVLFRQWILGKTWNKGPEDYRSFLRQLLLDGPYRRRGVPLAEQIDVQNVPRWRLHNAIQEKWLARLLADPEFVRAAIQRGFSKAASSGAAAASAALVHYLSVVVVGKPFPYEPEYPAPWFDCEQMTLDLYAVRYKLLADKKFVADAIRSSLIRRDHLLRLRERVRNAAVVMRNEITDARVRVRDDVEMGNENTDEIEIESVRPIPELADEAESEAVWWFGVDLLWNSLPAWGGIRGVREACSFRGIMCASKIDPHVLDRGAGSEDTDEASGGPFRTRSLLDEHPDLAQLLLLKMIDVSPVTSDFELVPYILGLKVDVFHRTAKTEPDGNYSLDQALIYKQVEKQREVCLQKLAAAGSGYSEIMLAWDAMLRFAVNGELHSVDESAFDVELTLLQYLRNYTTLHVGTKLACGEGGCGACTVLLSELNCEEELSHRVVNACIFLVADANGRHVTTIEAVEQIAAAGSACAVGHAKSKSLHPLQQSLIDHHGSQCGYCTPGFVVAMLPRWIQCEQEMRHSLATEGLSSIAEGTRGGQIKDIEDVLDGNLCRCTGYRSILQAFRHAFRSEFAKNDTSVEKKNAAAFAHFVSQAILPALTKLGELEITTGSEVAAVRGKALTASTSESSLFPGEYHHPKTVGDALRIAAAAENFKFQAGATERKIEQLKIANKFQYPLTVISLIHVAELSSLSWFRITPSQEIVIPANLPLGEIEGRFREFLRENEGSENGFARQVVKAYLEMFRWFAGHQVRNVATFGGNLATASPIADLSPVTMAVGSSVKVARSQAKSGGTSSADTQAEIEKIALPVDNSFFVAYRKTLLQPTDLLLSVHIPIGEDEEAGANSRQKMKFVRAYKASRRKEDDLSIVNGCFFVQLQKSSAAAPESPASYIVADCRFAFGGLAPFTRRCTVLEEHFLGKAFTSAEAFTEGLKLIEKFFQLPPDVPGGMSVFRKLLARSLFFKFWKEVGRELGVGATEDGDGGALFLSEHHELRKQHSEPAHQHFAVDRLGEKTPAGSGATKHLAGHLHVTGKALYSYDQVAANGSCAAGAGGPMSKKKSEAALAQQGDAGVEVPWHPGTRDCMILDFVLSTKPHAKIDYIDFSKAEKVPGFIGVLTLEDLKFCKRVGPIVHDDDVFPVDNVVTHLGQICACVLAETREAARQCCMVTTIVWKEEYDFVLSIEEAIAQESFHDLLFTAEKTKVHQIWKQEAEETGLGRNGSTSSGTVVDRFFAGEIQDARVALPEADCDVPAEATASGGENGAQLSETAATKNDKLLPDLSRLKSVLPPALVAPLPAAASTLPQGSTLAPVTLPGLRMSRPSTTHFGTSFASLLRRTGSAQNSDHDYEQVSGEVYMGGQEHFYFETHSTAVELRSEEEVFVYSSTQNIAESQAFISEVCGIPQHKIHVKTTRLGGGFGGKETRACVFSVYPVLACQKFSRSTSTSSRGGTHAQRRTKCKFIMERDTDSRTSGQRHSFVGQYKLLLDKRNKVIRAMDVKLFANAGVSHDLSNPVLDRGLLHVENCLSVPNVRVRGYLCKTNIPTNTAFRGFGGPQGLFVAEVMYQKAADVLGLGGKEELYEKMMYRGTTTAGGKAGGGASLELEKTFYNHAIGEWCPIRDMIVQLKAKCAFDARRRKVEEWNKRNKFVKRGIALMPTKYGISFTAKHLNQSGAQVNLYKDGSLLLHHGGHEMGQGVHTKVAAVAALMFDVPLSQIHIVETSTDAIPNTSPTAASAGSDLNGYACQIACAELLERLNSAKLLEKYGLKLVSDEATFVKPRTGNKSFARHRTSSLGEEVVGERVASKDGVGGSGDRNSAPPKTNDPGVVDTSSSDALFPPPTTGDHPGERIPFRRIDWSGCSAVTSAGSSKMEILGKIATDAWFARVNLCGRGFYATPISGVDWNKKGKNEFAGEPFYYYSWGVGVSEVELDTLTGDFQLLQTDLMHDVGRSLAPMVDIGQIEGAFTQGLGLFTSEEVVYLQSKQMSPGTTAGTSRRAAHFSVGPGFYKIPAVGNCPLRFETHLLENSRGPSVLGSKAIGEPPLFLACSVFFALREAMLSLVEDGAARVAIAKDLRLDSPLTAERLRIKCAQVLAMAGGSKDSATTERSLHEGLFDENGKWPEPCVSTAAKEGVINHWHARV
eukprot:g11271.t1